MRYLIKHFALWDIVLIIGVAAIVIFVAASASPSATAVTRSRPAYHTEPAARASDASKEERLRISKAAIRKALKRPQDDYYDRRRRYWEDRVERRLDEEEGLDDEDKSDSTDKKDKAKKGDEEDSLNEEEELIERRREYWRRHVEDEW